MISVNHDTIIIDREEMKNNIYKSIGMMPISIVGEEDNFSSDGEISILFEDDSIENWSKVQRSKGLSLKVHLRIIKR